MAVEERVHREKRRGSILLPLLLILFLGVTVTSGMAGFLLGKNASTSQGELIDTIVLSPGDEEAGTSSSNRPFRLLSGKVLYAAGEPCKDAVVRLRDTSLSGETGEDGSFCLTGVPSGSHTLEILSQAGETLAAAPVSLEFTGSETPKAETEETPYVFRLPEDSRMLEVILTVEEDESLSVQEGSAYFVTGSGTVADFSGKMLSVPESSYALTPVGNLVSSRGYVLLPSVETVVAPNGLMEKEPAEPVEGVVLKPDGSAETPEGVVVGMDGSVTLPSGETFEPEIDTVMLIQGESVQEVLELPEPYQPVEETTAVSQAASVGSSSAEEQDEPASNAGSHEQEADESASSKTEESSQPSENSKEESSAPVENLPPEGEAAQDSGMGFVVADSDGKRVWKQKSMVNLFKNRDTDLGMENGMPVIAPGISGFYEFQLQNIEDYAIDYMISINEESFHLPIRYSIVNSKTNQTYLYGGKTGEDTGLVTPAIRIPANSLQTYRLEWEWQYEDKYVASQDNAYDQQATENTDRVYVVSVDISAEQVTGVEDEGPGDGTRYPGKS